MPRILNFYYNYLQKHQPPSGSSENVNISYKVFIFKPKIIFISCSNRKMLHSQDVATTNPVLKYQLKPLREAVFSTCEVI